MKHVIINVAAAAQWLVEKGCKAAPVQAPSHSGVLYTQPGADQAHFAQAGDTLVWDGEKITAQS